MNCKQQNYLDKITQIYLSSFVNKITTTPIEINANPRRDHEPIVRMNCDSPSTFKFLVFAKNETSDTKINPTIKTIIPNPSTILFLFIRPSLRNNQIRNNQISRINHFGG
jgi:hypothetical protein